MKLSTISNNTYSKFGTKVRLPRDLEGQKPKAKRTESNDVVEISAEAYERQSNEKLTATSGKDSLEITKGSKDNTFTIHFSDSAMISRTVARGYITVNGTKIDLSDETKKQLTEIDKQAEADRERAFNKYIMQYDMAVAQQQGEVYKDAADDMSKAFKIAAKISNGEKVSNSDEKALMECSPQLYAMAKIAAIMAKRHEKQGEDHTEETIWDKEDSQTNQALGVDGSSFERKFYETQMNVSLAGAPEVQDVAEKEISVNVEV